MSCHIAALNDIMVLVMSRSLKFTSAEKNLVTQPDDRCRQSFKVVESDLSLFDLVFVAGFQGEDLLFECLDPIILGFECRECWNWLGIAMNVQFGPLIAPFPHRSC